MAVTYALPVEPVPSRYRCCHCLHVRSGTLLLSIFQIVVHFVIIAILTAALGRASRFRDDVEYAALSVSVMSFIQWERFASDSDRPIVDQNVTPIPLPEGTEQLPQETVPNQRNPYMRAAKYFMNAGEEYVAIAVTLISLLFSIMMLVGTIYAKPYYLLPYCCLQFIDLFVTCLSVVGFYTYLPESGAWIRPKVAVSLFVIFAGVVLLVAKAYLLAMVWLCYQFLLRYAAGLERNPGFSLAAGSCFLPARMCQRFGCFQFTPTSVHSLSGDPESQSDPSTYPLRPGSRRVVVLFHRPGSVPSPTVGSDLVPSESCLPPKYEDVVAMSSTAFDPPPYETIEVEPLDEPPQTNNVPAVPEVFQDLNRSQSTSVNEDPPPDSTRN